MNLPDYMRDLSQDLLEQSRRIARDINHAVTAGEAREEAVEHILGDFLPDAFGVARGFIFSNDGQRSSQTDLIIYDKLWSRPFYGQNDSKLFAVESVYAAIEVKTNLDRADIQDACNKASRFKKLKRDWTNCGKVPVIKDALYALWAFTAPSTSTAVDNLDAELLNWPNLEQPDLVVVPGRFFSFAGFWRPLTANPAEYHTNRAKHEGQSFGYGNQPNLLTFEAGDYSLVVFLFMLMSFLHQAGPRSSNIINYFPGVEFGPVRFPSRFDPASNRQADRGPVEDGA
jgi:uncharacterized protein DUF6602